MREKIQKLNKAKNPWPTKKAMEQVYEMNLWGFNSSQFYSGEGSHQPEIIIPYIEFVISFLTSFNKQLTVLDLGCGDFNVGKEFVKYTQKYIGIDIVTNLINYNKDTFKDDNLEFLCLDVSKDELPKADCVIVRQILQHLSNSEVKNIVEKLYNYKYIILTEHLPNEEFTPNKDIISGQGIRLKKQSGINLLEHPFNLKVANEQTSIVHKLNSDKEVIITTLYTMF